MKVSEIISEELNLKMLKFKHKLATIEEHNTLQKAKEMEISIEDLPLNEKHAHYWEVTGELPF